MLQLFDCKAEHQTATLSKPRDIELGRCLTVDTELKPSLPTLSLSCVVRRHVNKGRMDGGITSEYFVLAIANRQVCVCVETNFLSY